MRENCSMPSRLPRGIPAASLKQLVSLLEDVAATRLPRGIPAASLKQLDAVPEHTGAVPSSAGNTRGLIEATAAGATDGVCGVGLPRGIPAASLKRGGPARRRSGRPCLPRGIPAASLKRDRRFLCLAGLDGLPRGIPAASLKPLVAYPGTPTVVRSSAGNTRGLIEAALTLRSPGASAHVFRGEYPRPH